MKRTPRVVLLIVTSLLLAGGGVAEQVRTDDFRAELFRTGEGKVVRYRLFVPAIPQPEGRYPLILFLHGFEALGKDNKKQISGMDYAGSHVWAAPRNQAVHPCFVVAPQCPRGGLWANPLTRRPSDELRGVMELIRTLEKQYPIDRRRVYVTGQSLGGFGTWALVTDYPGYFAAGIPVCGGGSTSRAKSAVGTAIWAFHGSGDPLVPVVESRRMISAIRKAGGNPHFTEYHFKFHNVWNEAYSEPGLVDWLFRQRLGEAD